MTIAPLSINSQREEAVDFTKPFMTRYISVIMKKTKSETSYFEFLNPLSPQVWICTFGAFIIVSVILYFLEKLGMRKKKDYPSISFRESFWFIFGSLLQGKEFAWCQDKRWHTHTQIYKHRNIHTCSYTLTHRAYNLANTNTHVLSHVNRFFNTTNANTLTHVGGGILLKKN